MDGVKGLKDPNEPRPVALESAGTKLEARLVTITKAVRGVIVHVVTPPVGTVEPHEIRLVVSGVANTVTVTVANPPVAPEEITIKPLDEANDDAVYTKEKLLPKVSATGLKTIKPLLKQKQLSS